MSTFRNRYFAFSLFIGSALAAAVIGGCASAARLDQMSGVPDSAPPVASPIAAKDRRFADDHFVKGSSYQMQEKYAQAINEFRRSLRFRPSSATHYAVARCFRGMNRLDSAIVHARRSVELDPASVDARNELAELLASTGDWDSAAYHYESLLEQRPDNLQAHYMIARIWQRRNPMRAVEHYEYIRRNLDDNYEVLLNLAELYMNAELYANAADALRQALTLAPGNSDLYRLLADVYMRSERHADAAALVRQVELHSTDSVPTEEYYIDQLTEVIKRIREKRPASHELLDYGRSLAASALTTLPNAWRPRLYTGLVYYYLSDSSSVADSLLAASMADSAAAASEWIMVAETYLRDRQYARAVALLAPSVERFMRKPNVPLLLGEGYFAIGALDSAEKYTRLSLDAHEENGDAWGQIARIHHAQGKVGPSDLAYERALFYDPRNPAHLSGYAASLADRELRLEWALDMAREALNSDPTNDRYLDVVGWIYFKLGEKREALNYLERAAQGGSSKALEHLGDVRQSMGETLKAQDAYGRALAANPASAHLQQKLEMISQATQ